MALFVGIAPVLLGCRSRRVLSVFTRWFRSSDVGQDQEPADGDSEEGRAKQKVRRSRCSKRRSSRRGKIIPRLMKKFNLNDKLQQLLEQAGLKWNPVKLVHLCLAGFMRATRSAICSCRPKMRRPVLIVAAVVWRRCRCCMSCVCAMRA